MTSTKLNCHLPFYTKTPKNMTHEERARHLFNEAEKKMSPRSFFQSLFGSYRNRIEDAIECYQKAGNLFKLAKNWREASIAFKLSGDLNLDQNNRSEAANDYIQASRCLEKFDVNGAVKFLLSAIEIYTDLGRFAMAAKLHNRIAEIYEENVQLEEAVQHYEQAADYYKVEESHTSAKKCLLKIAEYASSEFQDYDKAIHIYEEVAFHDMKSSILQYNAKDSLFKSILCNLCVDVLNAKHALDCYVKEYPAFQVTIQYGFLKTIIECIEDSDQDAFSKAVRDFDNICRLGTWHTKILFKIKKQIKELPNLL